MNEHMLGVRAKIKRANEHIANLGVSIREFCDSEPYEIGAKPHDVPDIEHITLYVASVDEIPNNIALTIGDAVHNLRSSLDHLAWQLVLANGEQPTPPLTFPFANPPRNSHLPFMEER